MTTTETPLLTSDDLWSLPDDDKFERWLIEGELREQPKTLRSPRHSRPTGVLSFFLEAWCRTQPVPRHVMFTNEVYFRLRRDPDTNVGIDVALASAAQVAAMGESDRFIEGPPLLAVEVLSGSDTLEGIHEKIDCYLAVNVPVVWIVDPFDKTVTVYRPDRDPVLFTRGQDLLGDPELPGLRFPVAELFVR